MKPFRQERWIQVCSISVAVSGALFALASCSSEEGARQESLGQTSQAVTGPNPLPCAASGVAVTANSGGVIVNSGARVDSYAASSGPYGGANIGQAGTVRAATTITQNGGVIAGSRIPSSPALLPVVPVPTGARALPLGASSPGNVSINGAADSISLAPGSYVVANLNLNQPGAIKVQPGGPVRIWVTGNLTLGGSANAGGLPSNLTFFVTGGGSVNLNGSGPLVGSIYAPLAPVSVSTSVFGNVVGSSVTLNSNGAVHFDSGLTCPGPLATAQPPQKLPAPPRTRGCYTGTRTGWKPVACTPQGSLRSEFEVPDPTIQSVANGGLSQAIPFQFGEVEAVFANFGSVNDSKHGSNTLSVQANTNFFTGPNGHDDWVQFVVQTLGSGTAPGSAICIWNFDVTQYRKDRTGYSATCVGGGTASFNQPKRSGDYQRFDFATVGGSVFNDVNGAPSIGMVARVSWFDPSNDPDNVKGLYAVVAPDTYGLATRWTNVGGTVFGMGGSSNATFTNTSVVTRVLAGSCANASGPAPQIPWPGVCPDQPPLLPHTTFQDLTTTGETSNLAPVGAAAALASYSPDLVYTSQLSSTSGACISGASRAFVRDTPDDTGVVPSNIGNQPFWESPDIFLVPKGATVDVNAVASETLLTPGQQYDVYLRVNNDFSCEAATAVKANVYLADPSALSVAWQPITSGYVGDAANPGGITVAAGSKGLLGPLTFTAPTTNLGDGHKCLLASIQAAGEPAPASAFDAPGSFQVAQRNVQLFDCKYPLTNATASSGNLTLTLGATGVTPSTTGATDLEFSFDDPTSAWLNAWQPGAGVNYTLAHSGSQTFVRLGQPSVTLAAVPLAAGVTVTATGIIALAEGSPAANLSLAATLKDAGGAVLVTNGGTCTGTAPEPPG